MASLADTLAAMIARLDEAIARRGQTVTITKHDNSASVAVKAHVRAVKAEDLVGPVQQTMSKVILSPTGLDTVLPLRKGDKVVVDGRGRQIEYVSPMKSGDTLVRIELMVGG